MLAKTTHIFPAFTINYTGKEIDIFNHNNYDFPRLLKKASEIVEFDLTDFNLQKKSYQEDELKNQYLSYIICCGFSDLLKTKRILPDLSVGFSMGLYAALYHAETINFKTGLILIKDIYYAIDNMIENKKYGMFSVIGFSRDDLKNYCQNYNDVEIVIENGSFSYIIVSPEKCIDELIKIFTEEGAIHIGRLNVSLPYHSRVLSDKKNVFQSLMNNFNFMNPVLPLMSTIDQKILSSADDQKYEIVKNLISPLSLLQTIKKLDQNNISEIIEVGPGNSLLKSSKFIDGNFTFHAIAKGKFLQ